MDYIDAASAMAGRSRLEGSGARHVTNAHAVTGTAMADSSDGTVLVDLGGDVTTGDGSQWVEVQTDAHVLEGDQVDVLLVGEAGRGMSPVIYGVPGGGDRMAASVSNAEELATEAQEVAQATGQHFWTDEQGVHVTEVTQDEWNDSTSPSYHSGANVLLNALGQLFRDGLNNILAIVSGSDPGVAIYDGEGNAADNIMALFSKALIRIGGRLLGTGTSTASVQFFQSDASQTDITATHVVGSTDPPTGPDDVYGIEHNVRITTTTDGSELPQLAGVSGWAQLDMGAEVNPDYWAGSAILRARVGDDDEFGDGTPQLGVLRQVVANGIETAEVYMAAPTLALHDNAQYKTGRVPMEQAIAALTTPFYSRSDSIASIAANTDVKGGSLTVPAGTYIIDMDATIASSSGSGTRDITVGFYVGGSVSTYRNYAEANRSFKRIGLTQIAQFTSQTSIQAYVASSTAVTSASSIRTRAVRIS